MRAILHGVGACWFVLALGAAPAGGDDTSVEPNAFPEETPRPANGGFEALVEHEARVALGTGELRRAWTLLGRLLELDPDNTWAMRELGRVSAAIGASSQAIELLEEVDARQEHAPDPELHFVRGQALIAVGREAEGVAALDRAERQLANAPESRQKGLWLARIAALRGEADLAALRYEQLLPLDHSDPDYESISLQLVEAYLLASDWKGAERRLRLYLREHPDHQRARAMLAWVLESRGKLDEELALRAALAREWSTDPGGLTAEHARALERDHQYPEALTAYYRADRLGVDVSDAIGRLEGQLAPELAASFATLSDPTGDRMRWAGGASLVAGRRLRLSATTSYETSDEQDTGKLVTGSLWGLYQFGRGNEVGLAAHAWGSDRDDTQVGGRAMWRTSPRRSWRFFVRGEVASPWRESAAVVREGGTVDLIEAQVYAAPFSSRLVLMASGRLRRLGLEATGVSEMTHAQQVFGAAGVDLFASVNGAAVARGHMLDEELTSPASVSNAIVVSYRHYEMSSDDPFGTRLFLVERSRMDELSATVRRVIDASGILAGQAQGGIGYDSLREIWQWRAGGQVYLSPTANSRLFASFDFATESGTGLTGRRHEGVLGLHVDL